MEDIESVEDVNEDNQDEEQPPKAPVKAGALFSNPARNLTNEAIVAGLEARKADELSKIGPDEVVKAALPKLDKSGNPVRDAHGFVVIEERSVLKRDKVSHDWDKRIADVSRGLQG